MAKKPRPDKTGPQRQQLAANRKIIYATESICWICGEPVDKNLKYPHPLSKTVDHKIPVSKGGHPSALENLGLAHRTCNRQKSDKIVPDRPKTKEKPTETELFPEVTRDWRIA